jgi:oligoribonuclease
MAPSSDNLIWIDLEMTGLDPDADRILEIATVVTDSALNVIEEGPALAICQDQAALAAMDEWNAQHHSQSGLLERVRASSVNETQAERATLEFLARHVPARTSPMCGNSVCQDRRFLYRHMRELEQYFHYRNLDVSSIKELVNRWAPQFKAPVKRSAHVALEDIHESIDELRHYREALFRVP